MEKAEILRGLNLARQTSDVLNFQKFTPRPVKTNFTLPVNSWVSGAENFYADIEIAGITANDDAVIDFDKQNKSVVVDAEIQSEGDSLSGKLRIYAKKIPTDEIVATFVVWKG